MSNQIFCYTIYVYYVTSTVPQISRFLNLARCEIEAVKSREIARSREIVVFTKECQFCQSKYYMTLEKWLHVKICSSISWNFSYLRWFFNLVLVKSIWWLWNMIKKFLMWQNIGKIPIKNLETQTINLAKFDFAYQKWISRDLAKLVNRTDHYIKSSDGGL